MTDFPHIVVGTYEEFVLGFKPESQKNKVRKLKLHQTFATHSHQASVRCTAANEQYMASSGADEYINIYDMIEMKVSKVINYHDATVTCMQFTSDNTHLITGNQKGDIAIFRCNDWTLVKLWKEAHKSANGVTSMSVHPTGSLLLTTGADNIVRFWNLIKGRQAYATNYSKYSLGFSLNSGSWSTNGKHYVLCIGKQLEVYKTQTAAVIYKVLMNSKITCVTFIKKNLVCIGNEEGNLEIHSLLHKKLFTAMQIHKARLKCMSSFNRTIIKNNENKIETYLVTADSQGVIKLWCLKKKGQSCILLQRAETNCDCRITCLTIVPPKSVKEEETTSNGNSVHSISTAEKEISGERISDKELLINSSGKKPKKLRKKQKASQLILQTEKMAERNGNSFENNQVQKKRISSEPLCTKKKKLKFK